MEILLGLDSWFWLAYTVVTWHKMKLLEILNLIETFGSDGLSKDTLKDSIFKSVFCKGQKFLLHKRNFYLKMILQLILSLDWFNLTRMSKVWLKAIGKFFCVSNCDTVGSLVKCLWWMTDDQKAVSSNLTESLFDFLSLYIIFITLLLQTSNKSLW